MKNYPKKKTEILTSAVRDVWDSGREGDPE
jgi:hypothetical protein